VESARKVASGNEGAKTKPKQSDLVLPTLYVDSLIARASSGVKSMILDLNWCWRKGTLSLTLTRMAIAPARYTAIFIHESNPSWEVFYTTQAGQKQKLKWA
jgi:hypothetical protein